MCKGVPGDLRRHVFGAQLKLSLLDPFPALSTSPLPWAKENDILVFTEDLVLFRIQGKRKRGQHEWDIDRKQPANDAV